MGAAILPIALPKLDHGGPVGHGGPQVCLSNCFSRAFQTFAQTCRGATCCCLADESHEKTPALKRSLVFQHGVQLQR